MAKKFDIAKYAAGLQAGGAAPAVPAERDIEIVTAEILEAQRVGGEALLTIGNRLIEAKAMLPHGEWLNWLAEKVDYSERTAQRLMKIAENFSNPTAVSDLGVRKAFTLLALPPEERETFIAESHIVDGEEKSVVDMTSRELERVIKERDEARKAAKSAQAEAQTAEESHAKMEADMAALRQLHESAKTAEAQARDALTAAQAELKALREKPVEVAVETVVDQEAIDKAVAKMQAKVDAAEAARKAAEKQRANAEKALDEAKKQAGANAEILSRAEKAEAELAQVRRKLEEAAQSASPIHSDADLAAFNVLFSQAQDQANQMRELLLKTRERDPETAGKLEKAMLALAELVRGCVE